MWPFKKKEYLHDLECYKLITLNGDHYFITEKQLGQNCVAVTNEFDLNPKLGSMRYLPYSQIREMILVKVIICKL